MCFSSGFFLFYGCVIMRGAGYEVQRVLMQNWWKVCVNTVIFTMNKYSIDHLWCRVYALESVIDRIFVFFFFDSIK